MILTRTNHGSEIPLITHVDHDAVGQKAQWLVAHGEIVRSIDHGSRFEWRCDDEQGRSYRFAFTVPYLSSTADVRRLAVKAFAENIIPILREEFTT